MMDALTPIADMVLDLPVPPSVNDTRRVDWRGRGLLAHWKCNAAALLMASGFRRQPPIPRFEISITISEDHTRQDLDNSVKSLVDYLRAIEVITNDAKKNMRKLTVEWGEAPEGVRVTVRKVEA